MAAQNGVVVEANRCGYLWGRAAEGFLNLRTFPPFDAVGCYHASQEPEPTKVEGEVEAEGGDRGR